MHWFMARCRHKLISTFYASTSISLLVEEWWRNGDNKAERVGGGLQNMVVMELCEGGSLLKVLQNDDGRRRPRHFGWYAAL